MLYSQPNHSRPWHNAHNIYSHQSPYHGLNMNLDSFPHMDSISSIHDNGSTSIMISSQSFLPAVADALSSAIMAITLFAGAIASLAIQISIKFQDIGETLLAAVVVLSFLQAAVATYQYRYDVRGQLIFPDGPTFGVENVIDERVANNGDGSTKVLEQNDALDNEDAVQDQGKSSLKDAVQSDDIYSIPYFLRKLNKSLLLLLPWITGNVHNLLTKNSHLFHIGFIITLVRFLEDTMLGKDDGDYKESRVNDGARGAAQPSLLAKVARHPQNQDPIRVLVIGDSLAVGIGCVEVFDPLKNNDVPMTLVENVVPTSKRSSKLQPVFPKMLARTLSSQFQQPVHWRSGGVDGGDVNDIRKYCMDIIRQECAAADKSSTLGSSYNQGPPDIICVLFGMNDLKNLVSLNIIPRMFRSDSAEDGGGGIAHHFRRGMEALISEIRSYAPNAYIVFPQLPIQTFHKNSIVNILPLGVFVDTMIGFWEGQKRRVMEGKKKGGYVGERNTIYIDLEAKEIADWYCTDNDNIDDSMTAVECYGDIKDDILISAGAWKCFLHRE
ncbi:hypothetical protein ACHAWO_003460 [Cyclotella atomus]|uniref:SGNH hydrolase-type esterase domain-containing protein n=1 Tax=Cyclotella atomus TaxID=382360 RepID=A0ABD3NUQ2_9STRA